MDAGQVDKERLQEELMRIHVHHPEIISVGEFTVLFEGTTRPNTASGSSAHTQSHEGPATATVTSSSSSHRQDTAKCTPCASEDEDDCGTDNESSDSDGSHGSSKSSSEGDIQVPKPRMKYGKLDDAAPAIHGSAMLREVMLSCCFQRKKKASNS
jgi:hypothetical protein